MTSHMIDVWIHSILFNDLTEIEKQHKYHRDGFDVLVSIHHGTIHSGQVSTVKRPQDTWTMLHSVDSVAAVWKQSHDQRLPAYPKIYAQFIICKWIEHIAAHSCPS